MICGGSNLTSLSVAYTLAIGLCLVACLISGAGACSWAELAGWLVIVGWRRAGLVGAYGLVSGGGWLVGWCGPGGWWRLSWWV